MRTERFALLAGNVCDSVEYQRAKKNEYISYYANGNDTALRPTATTETDRPNDNHDAGKFAVNWNNIIGADNV